TSTSTWAPRSPSCRRGSWSSSPKAGVRSWGRAARTGCPTPPPTSPATRRTGPPASGRCSSSAATEPGARPGGKAVDGRAPAGLVFAGSVVTRTAVDEEAAMLTSRSFLARTTLLAAGAAATRPRLARAQESRTFTFGYDQPRDTAYSNLADFFEKKLLELSGGKLKIRQFPSAALGQEPEMAQKVRAGDLDFAINATANTATIVPQSGVFSLHFIFRDEAHLEKAVNDKAINDAFKQMIAENTTGARSLGLMTQGFRNMYAKFVISSVADINGKKVRVQATKTEDAFF